MQTSALHCNVTAAASVRAPDERSGVAYPRRASLSGDAPTGDAAPYLQALVGVPSLQRGTTRQTARRRATGFPAPRPGMQPGTPRPTPPRVRAMHALLCLAVSLGIAALLAPVLHAQTAAEEKDRRLTYSVRPSFTGTMNTDNRKSRETMVYLTYGQLRSSIGFDLWEFRIKSYLNADFKRQMYSDDVPRTLQDRLVFSVIPSMVVSKEHDISLFLEATMETQMANGERDGYPTAFMDPAYFYETLYLGQWKEWRSDDKRARLSARYGLGYAFQQTRTVHFLLTEERTLSVDPDNPLYDVKKARNTKLESGYSALFSLEYQNKFTDHLVVGSECMGVAQLKGGPFDLKQDPRLVGEFGIFLRYTFVSLKYDIRVVYDPNISSRRVLSQSATLGFMYEFND